MSNPHQLTVNNAFNLAVTAKQFISISSLKDIPKLHHLQADEFLVLGSATNLILDEYFDGTLIQVLMDDIVLEIDGILSVGAGLHWHDLIDHTLAHDLYGIENLTLIPGLVGASPVQNIGAYGVEIKDTMFSCEALNLKTLEIETFTNAQ